MAATQYLVFRLTATDDVWERCAIFTAASADAAKQKAALDIGDGTYAATPARSWQPATFKVQPRAVQVKT